MTHFTGKAHGSSPTAKYSLEELLVVNSPYTSRATLKKRLVGAGILKNECAECALGPSWNGKPLVLQLDHINGQDDDNRRENLRLLCPNCHTQTPTFTSRGRKRPPRRCVDCDAVVTKRAVRCMSCTGKHFLPQTQRASTGRFE